MPVDVIEMPSVLRGIEMAAASKTRFLFLTPNLNFLVNSRSDPDFRESLLMSDLCPADGMPILWLARKHGLGKDGATLTVSLGSTQVWFSLPKNRDCRKQTDRPEIVFSFWILPLGMLLARRSVVAKNMVDCR
jgi:hypothetical protein